MKESISEISDGTLEAWMNIVNWIFAKFLEFLDKPFKFINFSFTIFRAMQGPKATQVRGILNLLCDINVNIGDIEDR